MAFSGILTAVIVMELQFLYLYSTMKKSVKLATILLIVFGIIAADCQTRKDCGGRRKKKVMTQMGGYM
jgi:hypothetical protein